MPRVEPEPVRRAGVVRVQRGRDAIPPVYPSEMREGEPRQHEHPLRALTVDTLQGRGAGGIDTAQESGGGLVFLLMIKDDGAIF